MPTVDDLTISLTIKDNSNLDKLRKNVDALIKTGALGGAGGSGGGHVSRHITAEFDKIMREINYLKNYVVPAQTPSSLKGLASVAGGLLATSQLAGMKEKITTILLGKKGGVKDIIDTYKLEGEEDVQPWLDKAFEDIQQVLLEIQGEGKNVKKAHQQVNIIRQIFANLSEDMGLGRTLLSAYMKSREEEQKRMDKFLETVMGDKEHFIGQLTMARLKEDAFKIEKKTELLGEITKQMGEINATKLAQIEGFFEGIPDLPTLEEAFKALSFEFDKSLFDKENIEATEELKAIALVWLKRLLDEEWDPDKVTGAMGGYISYLNKAFKDVMDGPLFMFAKRLDYLLLGPKGKESLEDLGFKNITDALLQTLEMKGGIGELFKERTFYEPIAGAIINVLGSSIEESFTESKKINTAILQRVDMLEVIGETIELNVKRQEELQAELIKAVSEMSVIERLTKNIELLIPLINQLRNEKGEIDISKPENRDLFNRISDLLDRFGSTAGVFP
jgi:hypothetical protein